VFTAMTAWRVRCDPSHQGGSGTDVRSSAICRPILGWKRRGNCQEGPVERAGPVEGRYEENNDAIIVERNRGIEGDKVGRDMAASGTLSTKPRTLCWSMSRHRARDQDIPMFPTTRRIRSTRSRPDADIMQAAHRGAGSVGVGR
jgi:hypothetical protein